PSIKYIHIIIHLIPIYIFTHTYFSFPTRGITFFPFLLYAKILIACKKGGVPMKQVPFITIEGPIGVGKTSLAKRISQHFQFHFLGEIVEENPFLNKFYTDIHEWSFQTEMFFLCNRYKQLEDIEKQFLDKQTPVVADYHILKNLIFSERTLQGRQRDKYHQIYSILTED